MENKIIGYEFAGIRFIKEECKLESKFGVTYLRSGDNDTLITLIEKGKILKEDIHGKKDSKTTETSKTNWELDQEISRIRHLLWDLAPVKRIIETIDGKKKIGEKGFRFIAEARPIYHKPPPESTPAPKKQGFWSNTFNLWLFDKTKALSMTALGLLIFVILISIYFIFVHSYVFPTPYAISIYSGIQAFIILIAGIYYAINFFDDSLQPAIDEKSFITLVEEKQKSTGCESYGDFTAALLRAQNIVASIKYIWLAVLIVWFLLYVFLLIKGFPGLDLKKAFELPANEHKIYAILGSLGLAVLINFFNNLASLFIFLCFCIMYFPTAFKNEKPNIIKSSLGGIIIVSLLSVFEIFYLLYKFDFLRSGNVSMISQEYRLVQSQLDVFGGISGLLGGFSMALFFGRLQSMFLNPPTWLIFVLIIYVSIQPFFFTLNEEKLGIPLMSIALLSKAILFLFIIFLFQTERFLFYLIRMRKMSEKIGDDYDNFHQIVKPQQKSDISNIKS